MVDLTDRFQHKLFVDALRKCLIALRAGDLNDAEEGFIRDMAEEYQVNGSLMEPTRKQFDWVRKIAMDYETYVMRSKDSTGGFRHGR